MKAIETTYNGIRFRSRLEAKWAMFFNTLGIEWEYEPEGYELADGTRYLPDFIVRWSGRRPKQSGWCYAEVKPTDDPFEKARKFAAECGKSIWLCSGDPAGSWPMMFSATLETETGIVSSEIIEEVITFDAGRCRPWVYPSPEDCADALEAAAIVRSHRFWDPRRSA